MKFTVELSGSVCLLCIAYGTGNLVLRLFVGGETAWHVSQLQLLFLLHSKTVVSTIQKLHSQHAGKS